MAGLACEVVVLPVENQDAGKLDYINRLGAAQTVCMGNGRNDRLMLEAAALGVVLIQEEGAAVATVVAADVVCRDICAALDLLAEPLRLVATLRS
jgi:soluble P-type ATPase